MAEQRDVQALAEQIRDALKLVPRSRTQNPLGPWRNHPNVDTALAALDALVALLSKQEEALRLAKATGWNEADGPCWCPESPEVTGDVHIGRCLAFRETLAALEGTQE